jgi:hypothetical protein
MELLGVMFVVLYAGAAAWPVLGVISARVRRRGELHCGFLRINTNIIERLRNAELQRFRSYPEVRLLSPFK